MHSSVILCSYNRPTVSLVRVQKNKHYQPDIPFQAGQQ